MARKHQSQVRRRSWEEADAAVATALAVATVSEDPAKIARAAMLVAKSAS